MGSGGRAYRRADRTRLGRVRADGVGRARGGSLRLVRGAASRGRRRRARARAGRSLRLGDRQEPEHRPARLAEDIRPLEGLAQRRARLEPSRRSATRSSGAAGAVPSARRQGALARRLGRRARSPPSARRVPADARRGRRGAQPRRRGRGAAGRGVGDPASGQGLHHRARPGKRAPLAVERSAV